MGRAALFAVIFSITAFGQARFEVASIKRSMSHTGGDGEVTIEPARFAARNTTLKRLLFESWQIPYAQITGGPAWIDTSEFDLDARATHPVPSLELRVMLRGLLAERFSLETRTGTREQRVYILTTDKSGAHLTGPPRDGPRVERFHGGLAEFANVLAIKLSIAAPNPNTPGLPSRAAGAAVPVLNQTGIDGIYDLAVELQLEQSQPGPAPPGSANDTFTLWQRALREQLGLRLESGRAGVPFLTVVNAVQPTSNQAGSSRRGLASFVAHNLHCAARNLTDPGAVNTNWYEKLTAS
jgi:uncharacterized protein (TIGR03435 family)